MATQAEASLTTTSEHAANLALKKRFVAALSAGDWDTGASLMHPDFELREPDALPYGGTYKGIEGFKQCLGSIAAAHKTTQMETLHTYFLHRIPIGLSARPTGAACCTVRGGRPKARSSNNSSFVTGRY